MEAYLNAHDIQGPEVLNVMRAFSNVVFLNADLQEGTQAFLEKRAPVWTGNNSIHTLGAQTGSLSMHRPVNSGVPVGRFHRNALVYVIGDGTSEIQCNVIARNLEIKI